MRPDEFQRRMGRAAKEVQEAHDLLKKVTLVVEAKAKEQVSSGPNKAVRTGTLRRDINSRVEPHRGLIGNEVHYAVYVHEGTERMQARPYLTDGLEAARPDIQRRMEEFGKGVFKKVAGG